MLPENDPMDGDRRTPTVRVTHSWWAPALLLACVATVNVVCMPAVFWAGDPAVWREEARSMLQGHLAVDGKLADGFGENGQWFVQNTLTGGGRWYSKYGIVNSIMSLPPSIIDQWRRGEPVGLGARPDLLVFNLYQVFLSLLVCATLYGLSGWYSERVATRVIYVLAVFYTTYFWYFQRAQSSEIYQVLFYAAFFYGFVGYLRELARTEGRPGSRGYVALMAAWFFAGLLVLTRVLFGLLIPVIVVMGAVVIWRCGPLRRRPTAKRQAVVVILPACAVLGVLGWVNWVKFGSPLLTGYHVWRPEWHRPVWSYWEGLSGYLFDMHGSVLWYFPVLLFAAAALRRFSRRYPIDAMVMCGVFGLFYVVLGKTPSWRGEWTYGPRYMLFALPVLALPFLTWVDGLVDEPRRWRTWVAGAVTAATLLYSGYLTERQNRLEFFTYYRVSASLEPFWDSEMARYFLGHHLGWFCSDLLAHRDRLDELVFVKNLAARKKPIDNADEFRRQLVRLASVENYYWWR